MLLSKATYSAFRLYIYCQYVCSLGIEPTTFALLTQCSTTEPQEHFIKCIKKIPFSVPSAQLRMNKQHLSTFRKHIFTLSIYLNGFLDSMWRSRIFSSVHIRQEQRIYQRGLSQPWLSWKKGPKIQRNMRLKWDLNAVQHPIKNPLLKEIPLLQESKRIRFEFMGLVRFFYYYYLI